MIIAFYIFGFCFMRTNASFKETTKQAKLHLREWVRPFIRVQHEVRDVNGNWVKVEDELSQ